MSVILVCRHIWEAFFYPFIPLFSSFTGAPRTSDPINGNSEVRAAAVTLRILQIQSLSRQVAWFNSWSWGSVFSSFQGPKLPTSWWTRQWSTAVFIQLPIISGTVPTSSHDLRSWTWLSTGHLPAFSLQEPNPCHHRASGPGVPWYYGFCSFYFVFLVIPFLIHWNPNFAFDLAMSS